MIPPALCVSPNSWPSTMSWINLSQLAPAHAGPDNACATVGSSNPAIMNPQYMWCRKRGGEVSDSSGAVNHWWLWTDLDTGGRGWISAYYVRDQGNEQADDIYTHQPIPECP
jgi:hypothetical protein